MLLKAVDIYKKFVIGGNTTEVLKGININIGEGKFISIMGPSGSGKSTLLYILSGLDKPTSGTILYKDYDLSKMKDKDLSALRRREFGFVFQFYNLIPTLTVEENITLPMELDNLSLKKYKTRLDEILTKTGLEDKSKHFPYHLSGGQQQRVAIARALISQPKIIFADEPTGNLDLKMGDEILEIMRKLCKEEGRTIFMVTHDKHAASFSDIIINIRDGFISDVDTEIKERLSNAY